MVPKLRNARVVGQREAQAGLGWGSGSPAAALRPGPWCTRDGLSPPGSGCAVNRIRSADTCRRESISGEVGGHTQTRAGWTFAGRPQDGD